MREGKQMWPRPSVGTMTLDEFQRQISGGKVFVTEHGMPVAIRDSRHENFIKVWHRKPGLSSDLIWPYGFRFYANCNKLIARGIAAPDIHGYFRIRPGGQHVAIYRYMAGSSMEDLLVTGQALPVKELAGFYAELHAKGIFFRSLHPGNILRLDTGQFAVIDVTDTRFYSRPLSLVQRTKNLVQAWTRKRFRPLLKPQQVEQLLLGYGHAASLSTPEVEVIRTELRRHQSPD